MRSRLCLLAALAIGALAWVSFAHASPAKGAVLRVNTTSDEFVPHDGQCSLREAVATVDSPGVATDCGTAGHESNTIVLPAGIYTLSIAPSGTDDDATGDLNVTGAARVKIAGAGRLETVVDAARLGDRVLSVGGGASVTLTDLKITGGHPPDGSHGSRGATNASCAGRAGGGGASGGGIYNRGALTLKTVTVTGNAAGAGGAGGAGGARGCRGGHGGRGGSGGGIYNLASLTMTDSTVRDNEAGAGGAGGASSSGKDGPGGGGGSGGHGGGVYNEGELSVTASTISGNRGGAGGRGGAGSSGGGDGGRGASGGGIFSEYGLLQVTNSTLAENFAGAGGAGDGRHGNGGAGGDGGAIQVTTGTGRLLNATIADNGVGTGGAGGDGRGASGSGGGLSVHSSNPEEDMTVRNTIVASSVGSGCAGSTESAIVNGGHDLNYRDGTCPGSTGNPELGPLHDNGGPTATLALGPSSAAIDKVPVTGAQCPATDQRGVLRPQGKACDIGAFEFATPTIEITSPGHRVYGRYSRIHARFACSEGGITSPVATCEGTSQPNSLIETSSVGTLSFSVSATDKSGNAMTRTLNYSVWPYTNPLQEVRHLQPERIDMGVDYGGSGPILALGSGKVTKASDHDRGWPGGGVVVYRLNNGPFAGKYVYVTENITVHVRKGEKVEAGQRIATLHPASPNMETGWAAGEGDRTLATLDGHDCPCGDPGGWSTIEGRNFDELLMVLGAPSGYLQPDPPKQHMPRGWPKPLSHWSHFIPQSPTPMADGTPAPFALGPRWQVGREQLSLAPMDG